MTDARVSRFALESLAEADPDALVSRFGVEALAEADPDARVSRFGVEVLAEADPEARVSRTAVEVLIRELVDISYPVWFAQESESVLDAHDWSHSPVATSASHQSANAYLAVDGNLTNRWTSSTAMTVGMWWKADFGAGNEFKIGRIDICVDDTGNYSQDVRLQGSNNDSDWDDIPWATPPDDYLTADPVVGLNMVEYGGSSTTTLYSYYPSYDPSRQAYRYYRLYNNYAKGSWWSFREIEFYDTDVPGIGPYQGYSENDSLSPSRLLDHFICDAAYNFQKSDGRNFSNTFELTGGGGNEATPSVNVPAGWATQAEGGDQPYGWQLQFDRPFSLKSVRVVAAGDGNDRGNARRFYGSNDGRSWTFIEGFGVSTDDVTHTFTTPTLEYRYLQMRESGSTEYGGSGGSTGQWATWDYVVITAGAPVTGDQPIDVTASSESESVVAVQGLVHQSISVGAVSESESASTVAAITDQSIAVGSSSETESSVAVSVPEYSEWSDWEQNTTHKSIIITATSESETTYSVVVTFIMGVSSASETESAGTVQGLVSQSVAVGAGSESEQVTPAVADREFSVNASSESEAAGTVGVSLDAVPVGKVDESESANTVVGLYDQTVSVGTSSESEFAATVAADAPYIVNILGTSEAEATFTVVPFYNIIGSVGSAYETESVGSAAYDSGPVDLTIDPLSFVLFPDGFDFVDSINGVVIGQGGVQPYDPYSVSVNTAFEFETTNDEFDKAYVVGVAGETEYPIVVAYASDFLVAFVDVLTKKVFASNSNFYLSANVEVTWSVEYDSAGDGGGTGSVDGDGSSTRGTFRSSPLIGTKKRTIRK